MSSGGNSSSNNNMLKSPSRSSLYATKDHDALTVGSGGGNSGTGGSRRSSNQPAPDSGNRWQYILTSTLPLFKGENLQDSIENLSEIVSRIIASVGVSTFLDDFRELLRIGMSSLEEKLSAVPDERLLQRLASSWTHFLGRILPYIEGVFEPLQAIHIDQNLDPPVQLGLTSAYSPFSLVRDMSLISFRIHLVTPLLDRIELNVKRTKEKLEQRSVDMHRTLDTNWKIIQLFSIVNCMLPREAQYRKFHSLLTMLKRSTIPFDHQTADAAELQ